MAAIEEIVVTSCVDDPAASVYVWDAQSGTTLMTYRGDAPVTSGGISLLHGQYVVAALQDKPFLRMWPINSQQPLTTPRLVCLGKVTHAQVSPDNCYVALTVVEKLHVYQLASGQLVGSGVRHFQAVRVVRWCSDGNQVVCGGEDGLVTVWSLMSLTEPCLVLAHHTLSVTDVAVTVGPRSRLFSVSTDRSCKIYDLDEGILLVSVVCEHALTSVAVSPLQNDVFVGTDGGTIIQIGLLTPPRHPEYHLTEEDSAPVFTGHTKAVHNLSVSLSGQLLISGSADSTVKVWNIGSLQCLRTLSHKGPVTNAFCTLRPADMFNTDFKPSVAINSFKTQNTDGCIEVFTRQTLRLESPPWDMFPKSVKKNEHQNEEKLKSLQLEVDLLRTINSSLYKFTADNILEGTFKPEKSSPTPEYNTNKKKRKRGANGVKGISNCKPNLATNNAPPKKWKKKRNKNKKIAL